MPRSIIGAIILAMIVLFVGVPFAAEAQVRISVEWNGTLSGGPYVYAEYGSGGAYVVGSFGRPDYRYHSPRPTREVHVRRGVRIPPGHLPGPGQCRVWYPNRPPGHQPPPFRCSDRYRAPYHGGSVYGPVYDPRYGYGAEYGAQPEYGPDYGYDPSHGRVVTGRGGPREGGKAGRGNAKRWKELEKAAGKFRRDLQRDRRKRGGGR